MTVEFEGNWVQCSYSGRVFNSEDNQDFESGKYYWLMDVHGQIERCRLVYSGKNVRIHPRAKYLDTESIIGWMPDERKVHIARLMTDGDWDGKNFVLFTGGDE